MTEDEMLQNEARRRGISVTTLRMLLAAPDDTMRGIVEDNYRSPSGPTSMADPDRNPTPKRGSGWAKEQPLRPPPGVDLIDRIVEADSAKQKMKEAVEMFDAQKAFEREQHKRDEELDPTNSGIYDNGDKRG